MCGSRVRRGRWHVRVLTRRRRKCLSNVTTADRLTCEDRVRTLRVGAPTYAAAATAHRPSPSPSNTRPTSHTTNTNIDTTNATTSIIIVCHK